MKFNNKIVQSQNWDRQPKDSGFLRNWVMSSLDYFRQGICLNRNVVSIVLKRARNKFVLKSNFVKPIKPLMNYVILLLLLIISTVPVSAQNFNVGSHDISSKSQNSFTIPLTITNLMQTQSNFAPDLEIRYNKNQISFIKEYLPPSAENLWKIGNLAENQAGIITLSMRLTGSLMVNPWDHFLDLNFNWLEPVASTSTEIEIYNVIDTTSDTITVYFGTNSGVYPDIDGNDSLNFSDVTKAFALLEKSGFTYSLLGNSKPIDIPISLSKLSPIFKHILGLKPSLQVSHFNGKTRQDLNVSEITISLPISIGGDINAYTFSAPNLNNLHSVDIMLSLNPGIIDEIQSITPVQMGSLVRGQPAATDEYRVQLVSYFSNPADSGNLFYVLAKHGTGQTTSGISLSTSSQLEILSNPAVDSDLHLTMFTSSFDIVSPDTLGLPTTPVHEMKMRTIINKVTAEGLLWYSLVHRTEVQIYTPSGRFRNKYYLNPNISILIPWSELPKGVLIIRQLQQKKYITTKIVNPGK